MSDRMTPIPFGKMMAWVLKEKSESGSIFGVRSPYVHKGGRLPFLGEYIETPFGPAAGPHTQLAQNITAAYAGGARFFELKTVQTLDGEDLPVSKPCIDARDECYNVEWSTELRVAEALEEYIKAWFAIKLISVEFGLGSADGFMFNMSVGYDLEGIRSPKIDSFIEGLKDASATKVWGECREWAMANIPRFSRIDAGYIESISHKICGSVTLSTLHGCPPQEIERIASYLIREKRLNTFVKCNPTLLGYEFTRKTMDDLGFGYLDFDDHHFRDDLRFADAVPMLKRLQEIAAKEGLAFGVKLTNTLPVNNPKDLLAGDEMYMSGRALFPLTAEAALRLSREFDGRLPISWSGGADHTNIRGLYSAGIRPVTMATTLLKPGGYQRLKQIAADLADCGVPGSQGVDVRALAKIAEESLTDPRYRKPAKPSAVRKIGKKVPLLDCFIAPCSEGCPINQDIPEYISLVGKGRHAEALSLILDKNPLPFITGTICSQRCATRCTRNFYEEPVRIRALKLEAAEKGIADVISGLSAPAPKTDASVAIIGGGPAGLAAAYFLCRSGIKATVFERSGSLGGVVRSIIPDFRIASGAIDLDVEIVRAMGAEFVPGSAQTSVDELKKMGYKYVIFANGAWKHGSLPLEKGEGMDVFDFLSRFKSAPEKLSIGVNVAVIGGGNTAMDAARAAKRVKGVRNVCLVYRRTKQFMPADAEELELAVHEGVEFKELLAPLSHENGMLRCAKVVLGEPDESGRRSPVATDETVLIPADTVITAVGESVDTEIFKKNGITLEKQGRAATDSTTLETNIKGVYIAGDARRGPATVVEAIADARRAADSIAESEGIAVNLPAIRVEPDIGAALERKGVIRPAECDGREAERCLECSTVCENCVDVCPNRANVSVRVPGMSAAQIIHVDMMCNECGNCMTFCPWDSLPYKDKFTYFTSEKDFEESKNSGFFPLADGSYKIRLGGGVFTSALDDAGEGLTEEIAVLIRAAAGQIPIDGRHV